MRGMDDGFRRQLEALEKAQREELARVTRDSQGALSAAQARVEEVEAEMRILLHEAEQSKKGMEAKLRRLTHALGDLTSDL